MKKNTDGSKIVFVVFLVVGLFFLMPVLLIVLVDGFTGFILIPIIMFSIMGIVFVFMARLARKNYNTVNSNSFQTGDERHCIQCHESIETYHKFCPLCGAEQTDYIVCDYCGHHNDKRNLQCEKCNALIK